MGCEAVYSLEWALAIALTFSVSILTVAAIVAIIIWMNDHLNKVARDD